MVISKREKERLYATVLDIIYMYIILRIKNIFINYPVFSHSVLYQIFGILHNLSKNGKNHHSKCENSNVKLIYSYQKIKIINNNAYLK